MIDIAQYCIRFPANLYPYTAKEVVEVARVGDCSGEGWASLIQIRENFFRSDFGSRNPLNIPGPFYGAETDTCETGVSEAPDNVLMDGRGQEFICKQPEDARELRDVLSAALCECFVGYGADGNENWTLALIREWWATRFDLLQMSALRGDDRAIKRWRGSLAGEAEQYLREYVFFVEERRTPTAKERLPDLGSK